MKNTKMIVSAVIISALSLSSLNSVSASDFDCSTVDRETMKEIMDKEKNWETLTTAQEELLENTKECRSENAWEWNRMGWNKMGEKNKDWENRAELTDEQKEEMEEMKEILQKQKNGEELSDDEQEQYDEFMENRENKDMVKKTIKSKKVKRIVTNLSSKYKKTLSWVVTKIGKAFSKLSDEDKIEKYELVQEKLEAKLATITDSDKYSDAKKEVFTNIINEVLNQIDDKIEEIN